MLTLLQTYRKRYYQFRVWLTIGTFIGVVVHEAAHHLTCRWFSLPVSETCYFQIGSPAGYVKHAYPKRFHQSFAICVAPFFVNTVVSVLAYYTTISLVITVGDRLLVWPPSLATITVIVLPWVAFSAAIHSLPSNQDADQLWDHVKRSFPRNPLALLTSPVILFVEALNFLRYLGIDLAYGVFLGVTGFVLARVFPVVQIFPWWTSIFPEAAPDNPVLVVDSLRSMLVGALLLISY